MRERELRRKTVDELEALNIELGNELAAAAQKVNKQRRQINDELDRRARVRRGLEPDDTPTKDDDDG